MADDIAMVCDVKGARTRSNGAVNQNELRYHANDKVMALVFLEPTWPQVQYHVTRGDILRESLTPVANQNTGTTTEYPKQAATVCTRWVVTKC